MGDFEWIAAVLISLACIQFAVLAVLGYRYRRLQARMKQLQRQQQRQQHDIAGLCEAAVRMDRRVQKLALDLEGVWQRIEEWTEGQRSESSYQMVIERIRQGAEVEEIVNECGLTREEANLLLRLYGDRQSEAGDSRRY